MIGLTSGGGGITLPDEEDSERGLEHIHQQIGVFKSEMKTYDDSSFFDSSDLVDILSSSFSFTTLNHRKYKRQCSILPYSSTYLSRCLRCSYFLINGPYAVL